MKVQNQKIFKLQGLNSNKIFYKRKIGNDIYYRGKTLLIGLPILIGLPK